jgi:hypothetical protein
MVSIAAMGHVRFRMASRQKLLGFRLNKRDYSHA